MHESHGELAELNEKSFDLAANIQANFAEWSE